MTTRTDLLAYELRRLSDRVLAGHGLTDDRTASTHALAHWAEDADAPSRDIHGNPTAPGPGDLAKHVASSFKLRGADVDVALAVLGSEIDHEFGALLFHDRNRTELAIMAALYPRLEDRLRLADVVGADAPVVRRALLRRTPRDGGAILTATRRFRAAVFGHSLLSALPSFAELVEADVPRAPWITAPEGLLEGMRSGALCVITGGAGTGRTTWACSAARDLAPAFLRIDVARAAHAHADVATEIGELLEDAAMLGIPVVLDNAGGLLGRSARLPLIIEDVLMRSPAKIFTVADEDDDLHERLASHAIARVRVGAPDAHTRRLLWRAAGVDDHVMRTIADDLVLTPRQIANAAALVVAGTDPATAAFEQLPKTLNLALPDRTTAKLDALVLPAEVRAEIVELIGAIRSRALVAEKLSSARGRAVTAMFNGESGTGKTFACEVIAAEVGLPLMRVNVASLVDKYIGETEKNLARVFAQAQAQGGILFFDEADALFGNRTEVSRSADRYANLETNLLLQLMEQFAGVVLLTTNLKQNIDQAFMRRITYKVFFEAPEPPERERLWRAMLPAEEYAADVDFRRLARTYELTGGSIRAAVQRAAYRAASRGTQISMADLVDCAQLEVQGMGRVATSSLK